VVRAHLTSYELRVEGMSRVNEGGVDSSTQACASPQILANLLAGEVGGVSGHRVRAGVDVHDLAGDGAREVAEQEHRGIGDLFSGHVAA